MSTLLECLEISLNLLGLMRLKSLQRFTTFWSITFFGVTIRNPTALPILLSWSSIKGQCKVYLITWPVQNTTGQLLFLNLQTTRSTLFIKQI